MNTAHLKIELEGKDNLILEFSTAASTQSKQLSILGAAGSHPLVETHPPCSPVCENMDTTLPWSASMAAGGGKPLHLKPEGRHLTQPWNETTFSSLLHSISARVLDPGEGQKVPWLCCYTSEVLQIKS